MERVWNYGHGSVNALIERESSWSNYFQLFKIFLWRIRGN